MAKVKDKIRQDIYSLSLEVERLGKIIKEKNKGLKIAQAFEAEKTGRGKTKFDKYLELK